MRMVLKKTYSHTKRLPEGLDADVIVHVTPSVESPQVPPSGLQAFHQDNAKSRMKAQFACFFHVGSVIFHLLSLSGVFISCLADNRHERLGSARSRQAGGCCKRVSGSGPRGS